MLAEAAPKVAPKMRIGAIDATANLLLKQKYDVNGYVALVGWMRAKGVMGVMG